MRIQRGRTCSKKGRTLKALKTEERVEKKKNPIGQRSSNKSHGAAKKVGKVIGEGTIALSSRRRRNRRRGGERKKNQGNRTETW